MYVNEEKEWEGGRGRMGRRGGGGGGGGGRKECVYGEIISSGL